MTLAAASAAGAPRCTVMSRVKSRVCAIGGGGGGGGRFSRCWLGNEKIAAELDGAVPCLDRVRRLRVLEGRKGKKGREGRMGGREKGVEGRIGKGKGTSGMNERTKKGKSKLGTAPENVKVLLVSNTNNKVRIESLKSSAFNLVAVRGRGACIPVPVRSEVGSLPKRRLVRFRTGSGRRCSTAWAQQNHSYPPVHF